ncbi:MAG: phenylacetate--CoA ligase family protein [Gammaproteobacteria bacterium]|nr:phenylacetate--CoA ligase family protein [Gammaproteobacteria bacterium]
MAKMEAAPGWPSFPAGDKANLRALLDGLIFSQWWPEKDLRAAQQAQLVWLVRWAADKVPYYQREKWPADFAARLAQNPGQFWDIWREMPRLTKPELRALGPRLYARSIPSAQLPFASIRTSGSTGIHVEVRTTAVTRQLWDALTLREHLWSQRDFSKRLGIIRSRKEKARVTDGLIQPNWGAPVASLYPSGPSSAMHIGKPVAELAAWLKKFDPHYLLAYPSIMPWLMEHMAAAGERPQSLREIRFISEPLDSELETRLAAAWQVKCTDIYSANEVGYIAFRCLEHGALHVQSESLLVEIIDEQGRACAPGESGRVVVTALHNLATPLLRYEIGDHATVGEPCRCGRGLPVIRQILGRTRNAALSPEGQRYWPTRLNRMRTVRAIRQAQYVQTAIDTIEIRAMLARPLREQERLEMVRNTIEALGYPYRIEIVPVTEIPRGAGGKFEEFLSLLPELQN